MLLVFTNNIANGGTNDNISKHDSIIFSLAKEQQFWKDWISGNDDNTCPLQPFILSHTKTDIEKLDKEIKKLKATDFALLFVRVNIDNGRFNISYFTWNDDDKFINSIEWFGPRSSYKKSKIDKNKISKVYSFTNLSSHNIVAVDIKDRTFMDRDSVYLSLWHKGYYSRFAFYNPSIKIEKSKMQEIPFSYLAKSLQLVK